MNERVVDDFSAAGAHGGEVDDEALRIVIAIENYVVPEPLG